MIPAISGAVGPLGASEWSVGGLGPFPLTPSAGSTSNAIGSAASALGASGSQPASFGDALSSALNGLDQTQATASTAAQQLATGKLADPTQAVTAVENAALQMDLADQLRNKATDAVSQIFSTQI